MLSPRDFSLKITKQTTSQTKKDYKDVGLQMDYWLPSHMCTHIEEGFSVNLHGRGDGGDIVENMPTSPLSSVHCNQDRQQNWIQSRMWSAQQTQHSYNDTQQRNAVIQSICNLFSLGSIITGRSVFQHMHAYLVLLNNRKCYPVPLFHSKKKKDTLKLCFAGGRALSSPLLSSPPQRKSKNPI